MIDIRNELNFFKLTDEEHYMILDIKKILKHYLLKGVESLSYEQIIFFIKRKYPNASVETINKVLQVMLVTEQEIVRDDFLNKSNYYKLIPKVYVKSGYTRYYNNISSDSSLKKVLLISDTHIGNDNLYDPNILNTLYDWSINNNIHHCFHMGDLFEGIKKTPEEELDNEVLRQINLFKDQYPHPARHEMTTYVIKGNHDESLDEYFKYYDIELRGISLLDDSLYLISNRVINDRYTHTCININNFRIKLTHEAYASVLMPNTFHRHKIDSILEYDKIREYLDLKSHLLLSGHRHVGMMTNIRNDMAFFEHLYLAVPSTSKFNIDRCIAVVLNFQYNNNIVTDLIIEPLYYIDNNIIINEEIYFDYTKKNKEFTKTL